MTNDIADMTEEDERQAHREHGYEQGYVHAAETWDGVYTLDDNDRDKARERIACLIYCQTWQLIKQYIENHEHCWDLEHDYLIGFAAGMRKALDERDADKWLSRLPGYH